MNEEQQDEKERARQMGHSQWGKNPITSSTADELAKLVALKAQGVMSDEEFTKQKLKLLS